MTTKIAFLGLGTMGIGMARRLASSPEFQVTAWNRNPEKAASLAKEGASVARTPAEAVGGAQIVIAMVTDDAASRSVWLGDGNAPGALAAAPAGAILIESSTLSIQWVRELAAVAGKRGLRFLDAPVTGTKPHAANGELIFLVGGDGGDLEAARPVLARMSKQILHLGPTGSGAAIKLINNFVCGVQAVALAEARAFALAAKLDPEQAMAVLLNGAPGSPLVKTLAARHSARDPEVNVYLHLIGKDLGYAVCEAEGLGVSLTSAAAALRTFEAAESAGEGDQDLSAIIRFVEAAPARGKIQG